ncbi:hypothetical protein [Streptomyces aureocirculatus]|uniref:hypothetical protein n=1 Tax=Streptomyces aureocirculatus TaxID=67275 RepID=UPI00147005F7|nr:hypothetical protein [Streptomyces aureocirculatus]
MTSPMDTAGRVRSMADGSVVEDWGDGEPAVADGGDGGSSVADRWDGCPVVED